MDLTYVFNRAKLPSGLSFPLKRSVLDTALREAGVSAVHCVYFSLQQGGRIVMRADYCGEGHRGRAAAGRASITLFAVPSAERQEAEACLLTEVLPRLVGWLRELELSGNVRRGVDQHFNATLEAETTRIVQS